MAAITPVFSGAYTNGPIVYNVSNYTIGDNFKYYVDSMEVVYDSINDLQLSGFSNIKFLQNTYNIAETSGSISITLVGDLPKWLMQQLLQLSKAVMGGGMELSFTDAFATYKTYKCKWENAGDFVENSELLCGGTMQLRFYYFS